MRLVVSAGGGKMAHQLGMQALRGNSRQIPDTLTANCHWILTTGAGHPLVTRKLAELYRDGGPGLTPDNERAEHYV